MKKIQEKSSLPLITGGKFRFIREQAGIPRHQFASFAGICVSTVRNIEVYNRNERVKIAYIKALKELIKEDVFNLALRLYKKLQQEGNLGEYY